MSLVPTYPVSVYLIPAGDRRPLWVRSLRGEGLGALDQIITRLE